jgi:uncharacterized membrane protein
MSSRSDKWVFGLMLAFGITALIASFALTLDKFEVLQNPNAILSCSINLVLDCSRVMQTWQSSLFGFPNMVIGLMGFPIVITVALAGLGAVKFPRWFLVAFNIGVALAALFAFWLVFQSIYAIQILCPWCLVVTVSMSFILSAITHYNLVHNTFNVSKSLDKKIQAILSKDYDKLIVASWLVLLTALIFIKFGTALFA